MRCISIAGELIFDRSSSLKIVYALCRFGSKARAVRMRHTRIEYGGLTTRLLHKWYGQTIKPKSFNSDFLWRYIKIQRQR